MQKEYISKTIILKKVKYKENGLIFFGLDEDGKLNSYLIYNSKTLKNSTSVQIGNIVEVSGQTGRNFTYPKEIQTFFTPDFYKANISNTNIFFDLLHLTYLVSVRFHSVDLYNLYFLAINYLSNNPDNIDKSITLYVRYMRNLLRLMDVAVLDKDGIGELQRKIAIFLGKEVRFMLQPDADSLA